MRVYAVLGGVVITVAAVATAVHLVHRQDALERRIDELAQQLGAADDAALAPPVVGAARAAAARAPQDSATYAARLRALEVQLPALRADVRSLEQATGDIGQAAVSDQQILAVMKQQDSKVMDAQLNFHRERWLDQREDALTDFSSRYQLTSQQNDRIWSLLSTEIDKMIELLRRTDLRDKPEQASLEWREILRETDEAASDVLEPLKLVAWDQQREAERKLLWPWLPQ